MMWPERRWEVNGPRTGRSFTPAAAPPSTEVKQGAIPAAPPASSLPGLTRKYGMGAGPSSLAFKKEHLLSAAAPPFMPTRAAAPPFMPTRAAAPPFMPTRAAAPPFMPCLRTTYTCAETAAAGISNGQKKPEMGRMFFGVPVDGSNEEDEEGEHLSIESNVGRSSARSTGSSPSERSRSPEEVRSMDKNFKELLEDMQKKWVSRQKALQDKHNELNRMVEQVQQMARECGANESTPDLWLGVLEIIHSKRATKFFMGSDPVGRMIIIKHFARINECQDIRSKTLVKRDAQPAVDSVEKWEEEFYNLVQDYNNAVGSSYGTSVRELLPSGPRLSEPSRLQVSSSGLSKRRKTT